MAQRFALSALLCLVIVGCSKPVEDTPLAKGKAAFRKGDFDEAIELLTKAIEQNAHDSEAYLYRGQAYITKGSEFSGPAIADYSEAIRLSPEDCEAYYNRAIAYRRKGESTKALQDDMMARRLDPAAQRTGKMYSTTPEEYRLAIERAAAKDPNATPEEVAKAIDDEPSSSDFLPEKIELPESLEKRLSPEDKAVAIEPSESPVPSATTRTRIGLPERDSRQSYGSSPPSLAPREDSLSEKLFGEEAGSVTARDGRPDARRPLSATPPSRLPLGSAPRADWNTGSQPTTPLAESPKSPAPEKRSPVGTLPFGHPYQSRAPGASYSPYAPTIPSGSGRSPSASPYSPYAPYSPYGGGGPRSTGIQSRSAVPTPSYNPYGGGALPTPRLPYGP
jgi:hypothetical protein